MDSKKTVYPYIPNSAPDVQAEMMAEVGISDVMELYEEIPEAIRMHPQAPALYMNVS